MESIAGSSCTPAVVEVDKAVYECHPKSPSRWSCEIGCKYARLYTFLSHGAIFEDNFNLHLILLELRSFFFQFFFYLLDMLHVKIFCALFLS